MATGNFTIDDAFQSDDEDPIRIYGSLNESSPLQNTSKMSTPDEDRKEYNTNTSTSRGRDYDVSTSVHSDGSNEVTDTSIGLLSGQVEGRSIYRSSSAHSFGSSHTASVSGKSYSDKRWWKHPKVKENWRIVLASFVLLIIGIGLFVTGIAIEVSHTEVVHSFVFFIAGTICLIPGAYHVVYIYCAMKGKSGFSLYNLPVFR